MNKELETENMSMCVSQKSWKIGIPRSLKEASCYYENMFSLTALLCSLFLFGKYFSISEYAWHRIKRQVANARLN